MVRRYFIDTCLVFACCLIGFYCLLLSASQSEGQIPQRAIEPQVIDSSLEIQGLMDDLAQANKELALRAAKIEKLEDLVAKLETLPKVVPVVSEKPKPIKPYQSVQTHTTPVTHPIVQSTTLLDPVPGHWTYPGDLDTHLRVTHGQNVDGMTLEQKLILHDHLHEHLTAVIDPTVSSCPGGYCPNRATQTTTTRYYYSPRATLFRR